MHKILNPVILLLIAFLSISLASCSSRVVAQEDAETGMRFDMTMNVPGRDPVELSGAALGTDSSLAGTLGGITTRTILTGGRLYSLNPSIKTAREIENPPPPATDEDGWAEWLIEPGRINPLTFATTVAMASDFDGETTFGDDESVNAVFDHGKLSSIEFDVPEQDEPVTYTYSGFEEDEDISPADFDIPDDYILTEL